MQNIYLLIAIGQRWLFQVPLMLPTYCSSQPLELDYFEEAVDYLSALDVVNASNGIGLCGISKGNRESKHRIFLPRALAGQVLGHPKAGRLPKSYL